MSKKGLIRSTGIISLATTTSRVLGFLRDIVIARFFGTAVYAQAFVVAFRIPNLLRDLIGEGATNAAIVPVLTGELTRNGKGEFFRLARILLNILLVILIILTVTGMLASPLIVRLMAPGFIADSEKFQATVTLTRILFPFLLLVGLWAYAMGVLNSLGKFASASMGPCVLNACMIVCAIWFGENVFGLASGVLAGGILQLLIQFPSLFASGWRPVFNAEFTHPQVKKIGILLIPRTLGSCVYQVNVFISTILASLSGIVGEGAVAALYYANRVWQLPLAIFGVALAQAALPAMSRHVAQDDVGKLKEMVGFSIGILSFILVPATVGLMILKVPITRVLFERGAFTVYSTAITSDAIFYYAIGLVACGGTKVLVSAFYSLHDTMTPVKTAFGALIINIVLNLALMWPLKIGGLALATSISSIFNFIALYILLRRRLGDFGTQAIIDSFLRTLAASLSMSAVLSILVMRMPGMRAMGLALCIITGMAVFAFAGYLFNVRELKGFIRWISAKR
jgi:putative peptidoglycan lipid II flippase